MALTNLANNLSATSWPPAQSPMPPNGRICGQPSRSCADVGARVNRDIGGHLATHRCPPAECMARGYVMHMRWSRRQSAAPSTNLPPRFSSRVHLAAHHQRMPLRIWSQNGNGGSPCSSIFRRVTTQASSHTQYHTISAEKHIISNLDRPALTNQSSRVLVVLRCKCVELTPASLCSSLAP